MVTTTKTLGHHWMKVLFWFFSGRTKLNLVCVSPKSNNLNNSNDPPTGPPLGSDNTTINVRTNAVDCAHKVVVQQKRKRFCVDCACKSSSTKIERFINGVWTRGSTVQSNSCSSTVIWNCGSDLSPVIWGDQVDVDVEQHVPFDSSCYPNGTSASLYMTPPSSPPRNCTHDWKHQKKKLGLHSCQTKPNKLNLILPLLYYKLNFIHHSLKYDREQSCADKSSAGSNHTSNKKHHSVCHLNPTIVTRKSAAKMKKKRRGVVNSVLPVNSKLYLEHLSTTKWIFHKPTVPVSDQKVSPTLLVQKAYLVQAKKKKILIDILEEIPEAWITLAWKLAHLSKGKEYTDVPESCTW